MTLIIDNGAPRNPYKGIRKVRKAQWVYDCKLCDTTTKPRTDLFGACEARRQHINGQLHFNNTLQAMAVPFQKAINEVAGAFGAMATTIIDSIMPAMQQMEYVLAPPRNMPHDPSLWDDKRKWGGR